MFSKNKLEKLPDEISFMRGLKSLGKSESWGFNKLEHKQTALKGQSYEIFSADFFVIGINWASPSSVKGFFRKQVL